VPKKGRPVTQCQHCRVERKKRSAHVSCDCGKSHHTKEKCVHLRNADVGHGDLQGGSELGPVPEDHELEDTACCCSHGGACTCATYKKEHGHDFDHQPRHKPRLTTTRSDGHINTFVNGHHKPIHRNNNAAHESLPYKLPRAHTDHTHQNLSRRSVDSAVFDRLNGSASLPNQPSFNFATPPGMTPPSDHTASMENLAMDGFPLSNNQNLSNPSVDDFDFSQLDVPQIDGFGMSVPVNGNTTPNAMPYSGPVSASVSDANLDFSHVDWSTVRSYDNAQPALTYASSNTHSDFGEHSPPEEIGSLFGNHNFMRSMQDMPTHVTRPAQSAAGSSMDISQDQPANQGNRWSLPPSFWTASPDLNTSSSSNTSAENLAGRGVAWGQPPTSVPAIPATRPAPIPRSSMTNSSSRPRPQAVYQKSNTISGDPGWENLLKQHQAGNLWDMDDFEQLNQPTESFANMATKTVTSTPMEGQLDTTPDIGVLQRTDSDPQQFFMDPVSISAFGFNGDFTNPGYFSAWPQ